MYYFYLIHRHRHRNLQLFSLLDPLDANGPKYDYNLLNNDEYAATEKFKTSSIYPQVVKDWFAPKHSPNSPLDSDESADESDNGGT